MVAYPLAMPDTGVASSDFTIMYNDAINTLVNGETLATELSPAYWVARIQTANAQRRTERFSLWRRFFDALRGSKKVCLLYDADLPYPQAYDSFAGLTKAIGGAAFVGTGDVDSVTNPRTYVISGLPEFFNFTAGDYISFMKSGRYWLSRIVDDEEASISGVATLVVEPAVPSLFDAASTYNIHKALGEFILEPNGVSAPRGLEGGSFSFSARSRAM